MIERSRTLFVGFIAFVLVLVTFSSFQKNKQTEGLGSITCKNSPNQLKMSILAKTRLSKSAAFMVKKTGWNVLNRKRELAIGS